MARPPGFGRRSGPVQPTRGPRDLWQVWGKSRGLDETYPLVCHLLDAGLAARYLFVDYLSPGQRAVIARGLCGGDESAAQTLAVLVAAAHDVGKCTPGFQVLAPADFRASGADPWPGMAASSVVGHPDAGAVHFEEWLERRGVTGRLARQLALVVGGHHGRYPAVFAKNAVSTGVGRGEGTWHERRDEILDLSVDSLLGGALDHLVETLRTGSHAHTTVALNLLTGLVITADWLVSDVEHFVQPGHAPRSWSAVAPWITQQQVRVQQRIREAGLGGQPFPPLSMAQQFPELDGFQPRGIQTSVVEELVGSGPGLFVLMDQAGGGKTEAALHLAAALSHQTGAPGVLVALPTMATTDAMVGRVKRFLEVAARQPARLTVMHSLAALNEAVDDLLNASSDIAGYIESDGCAAGAASEGAGLVSVTDWLLGRRRGLLADNTVCTIDQILAVAIAAKWQPLPFLGLTRRVVVIDEVHAQDAHMQQLTMRLVAWLGATGVSVVAMSATVPTSLVHDLVRTYAAGAGLPEPKPVEGLLPYPGWVRLDAVSGAVEHGQGVAVGGHVTRLSLRTYPVDEPRQHVNLATACAQTLQSLSTDADGWGNALVLMNTVRGAVSVFERLRDAFPDLSVTLVHARFPNGVRAKHAENLLRMYGKDSDHRPRQSIVVATQVAEQSLDVDFDVLLTELAPFSALVQRDGRLHRHARTGRPGGAMTRTMYVLAPHREDDLAVVDQAPYDQADLMGTWRVLRERVEGDTVALKVPDDVPALMESAHDRNRWAMDPDELLALVAQNARADVGSRVARAKAIGMPQDADLADLTRQDQPTPDLATRFDLSSVTVLPVVRDHAGVWRMSHVDGPLLPVGRPTPSEMREVMRHCVSLSPTPGWEVALLALRPAVWEGKAPGELPNLMPWRTNVLLRHVAVTEVEVSWSRDASASTSAGKHECVLGSHLLVFDPLLGCLAEPVKE